MNSPSSTTNKCSVDLPSDSQATSPSSNTSKCISSGDTNANYKITPISVSKVLNKDEGADFPSTSKILETNRPAGLENWRYVCVQKDNGLLDDEQIYRNEILSKSGEVMGKIQDERRKSLVGMNTPKINVKELTPGTSTKTVLNDPVKASTAQAKSIHASVELEKTSVVGTSSKPDNKVPENAATPGTSSNSIITLSTQGARSKVSTLSNPKKMSKINADKGENKRYKRYQWNITILKKLDLYCISVPGICIYKSVSLKSQFLGLLQISFYLFLSFSDHFLTRNHLSFCLSVCTLFSSPEP